MYGRRRYWHRRSNTPMYYSRNPTKKLTPYLNNDPYRIESRDLPKAAKFLSQNGYTVVAPGSSSPTPDNRIVIDHFYVDSVDTLEIPQTEITFTLYDSASTTISVPNLYMIIIFTQSTTESTFALYYNGSGSATTVNISRGSYYWLAPPPDMGTFFFYLYTDYSRVFETYEPLSNSFSHLCSMVFDTDHFSFVLN